MRFRAIVACVVFVLAACQGLPLASGMHAIGPEGPPDGRWREQLHWLPVGDRRIQARLCRPERQGPAPLVVINHGSPPNPAQRAGMRPGDCDNEAVSWFLLRGYSVLLPLRRATAPRAATGPRASGAAPRPISPAAGRETARDILAAVEYGTRLPGIRTDGVSRARPVPPAAGGRWRSRRRTPPQVARVVNMAVAAAVGAQGAPNTNCRPDRLVAGAPSSGAPRGSDALDLHRNDSFFGRSSPRGCMPPSPRRAARRRCHALEPWRPRRANLLFGGDGGTAVWGPILGSLAAGGDSAPLQTAPPADTYRAVREHPWPRMTRST
jgi:hypothetical protein